jgi:hypothetical protein
MWAEKLTNLKKDDNRKKAVGRESEVQKFVSRKCHIATTQNANISSSQFPVPRPQTKWNMGYGYGVSRRALNFNLVLNLNGMEEGG